MKIRPRILRQKYKDPMTADGQWELITQVQPGASGNKDGLPIVGVRSRSMLDSFRIYQNKTLLHDWVFTADQNLLGVAPVVEDEKVRSLLKGTVGKGTTDAAVPATPKP